MMLEDLIHHRPAVISAPPTSAVVVQVAGPDVMVVPTGADERYALGPCRGTKSRGGEPLPVGAHVLIVFADDGPWITAVDE